MFEKTLDVDNYNVNPNDIIVMYTDGITETMNAFKMQFGLERLKKIILENSDKPAGELKSIIYKHLSYFRGEHAACDDSTLILLKAV